MEFPSDEATFSNDGAFMVGNSLLVQGIYTEQAKHVSVYLPGKQPWYDLRTGTVRKGRLTHKLKPTEESIPPFLRAGTIVPRKDRFRRSSTQMMNDPYSLVIALNSSQAAEGELHIDDGSSFDFLQGAYALIEPSNEKVEIENAPLSIQRSQGPLAMTIRRPNFGVSDNWTIKIL